MLIRQVISTWVWMLVMLVLMGGAVYNTHKPHHSDDVRRSKSCES